MCLHTHVWVHVNVCVPSPEVSVSVSLITLYFKICACVCTSMRARSVVHMWEPVDSLWESVFSFCHLGSRDQTQAVRLENRLCYLLSHFASLPPCFLRWGFILNLELASR